MSCGCLAARRAFKWLEWFPFLTLATIVAAVATFVLFHFWKGLALNVGNQAQEVFFGPKHSTPMWPNLSFRVELIAALFFILLR